MSQATGLFTRARTPTPPGDHSTTLGGVAHYLGGLCGRAARTPGGRGVASDKLFYAGEDAHAPRNSPCPLTEGDSKSGGTEGGQRKVPPLKGDKGGFTEVDSPYPLSEGDIKGGGTEGDSKDSKDFKPLKPF